MEIPQFVLIGGAVAASMFLYLVYRTVVGEDRPKDGDPPREL
jgi:hypothetical protein